MRGISLGIWGTGLPLSTLAYSGTPEQLMTVGAQDVRDAGGPEGRGAVRDRTECRLRRLRPFGPRPGATATLGPERPEGVRHQWRRGDVFVVVATVDPTSATADQAAFIVDSRTPGIRPGKKEKKLGIRASDTSEVLLEDCRIPLGDVLGGAEKLESRFEKARTEGVAPRRR